jgi:hypothetical protein
MIMPFLAKRTKVEGNVTVVTQDSGEKLTCSFNRKDGEDSRATADQAIKPLQSRVKQHANPQCLPPGHPVAFG